MNKPINLHTILSLDKINVLENVKLVPLNESHGLRILEILSEEPNIRKRVTVASRMNTLEDVKNEIDSYKSDSGLIRYVLLKKNNPVGMISLWRDDGFWGEKNLDDYGFGYFLDRKERGQGLITTAIKSLMEIVDNNLYVHQFVAFCEDDNKPSVTILKKLGFKPTDKVISEPNKGWVERKYEYQNQPSTN